jgi:hypothetical protein
MSIVSLIGEHSTDFAIAFQTAVALAESQAPDGQKVTLNKENLSEVVNLASKFKKYIDKLNKGQSAADIAGQYRLREAEAERSRTARSAQSSKLGSTRTNNFVGASQVGT